MDAELIIPSRDAIDALPSPAPLEMPKQRLDAGQTKILPSDRLVLRRRLALFASTIGLSALGAYQAYTVFAVGGLTIIECALLCLFVPLFTLIAFSFVNAILGLAAPSYTPPPGSISQPAADRTALLFPIYNEAADLVFSRVRATLDEVLSDASRNGVHLFILSDSTDPDIWLDEEEAFLALRRAYPEQATRLFYRHRVDNAERKAGNVAEWVSRFGDAYDFMIVFDADSLMSGETIDALIAMMKADDRAGLIQTVPQQVNGSTLFARLQQFASWAYGPLIARGLASWSGREGNYWGHNAIIRVKAFAAAAGLPPLPGKPPLGGDILSHDFVEAALLRRAGWSVHLAPDLGGSYEEGPPTLMDFAVRDRRWCQGNLQHMRVVSARGLHPISRLHLLIGISSYLASPLWLLFLLLGLAGGLQAHFIRPEYFPSGATLFPIWPAQDPKRAAWLFVATMALLLFPKVLGIAVRAMEPGRKHRRLISSALAETIFSALISPVMMVYQVRAVYEVITRRDSGWSTQARGARTLQRRELMRFAFVPTMMGVILAAASLAVSPGLFAWMLPITLGLVLSFPVTYLAASSSLGHRFKALDLFTTPHDDPPLEILHAGQARIERGPQARQTVFERLSADPGLRAFHLGSLPCKPALAPGVVDTTLVVAAAKIGTFATPHEAAAHLSSSEKRAVLADRDVLAMMLKRAERS